MGKAEIDDEIQKLRERSLRTVKQRRPTIMPRVKKERSQPQTLEQKGLVLRMKKVLSASSDDELNAAMRNLDVRPLPPFRYI